MERIWRGQEEKEREGKGSRKRMGEGGSEGRAR